MDYEVCRYGWSDVVENKHIVSMVSTKFSIIPNQSEENDR